MSSRPTRAIIARHQTPDGPVTVYDTTHTECEPKLLTPRGRLHVEFWISLGFGLVMLALAAATLVPLILSAL